MPRASTLRQQRQVEKALNPPEQGDNFQPKNFLYIFFIQKTDFCEIRCISLKIYRIRQILWICFIKNDPSNNSTFVTFN